MLPFALLIALLTGCQQSQSPSASATTQKVVIRDRTFNLELALTSDQRHQGLSDRKEIAEDGGMLFVFAEPDTLEFVMRRCLVPIDIVYLSPNGRIVAMHEMQVEPYDTIRWKDYSSIYPAQFAVELKGGTIRKLGLEPGEAIALPLEELKSRAR